ncbi:6-phosphogluconolactonase [Roseofilum reptotaenium CS-1145]|uniref:6-phosphogluconolactonase n=1 Tax=Roseofilum reptotaenium AO1-A TaxID=1925591 RepID=A0A1L9QTH4_9CYAN|nr:MULTISPECIES: 6-phosphogluconolactonase [Roseofilum]MBP0028374.1 6-phosphogluconolactonase [Roseofilum sp. Guam]MDB9518986.1 6-phosphogluconolactonase [Roseofilum reptotaenium CS-1145]OJJ25990.1 6-phosphogluconolactonase [Roseofilum reptotaenium AO1-A]
MTKIIEVLPDKGALVSRALALVKEKIETAIASHGYSTIALAGGSTPKPLYEALSKETLPWDKIHVFWGDERYVPCDHPDSNENMARQAWLNQVPIPPQNIHAMPTRAQDPQQDAETHDTHLRQFFGESSGEFPAFDIILLGMGDDGHTASLFPHTEALAVGDRRVTVGNKDGQPRLTFTVPLINEARCVIFLVAGANKINALTQVFAPEGDSKAYPSRLIAPKGELWWLLDEAAGGSINT